MSSRAFIYLGLLLAVFLLISSQVAANNNEESKETNGLEKSKYPDGGYNGGGGYPGGGGYNGGGRGGGGYCRYGRCCGRRGRGYYGSRGCPCCYSANQAAAKAGAAQTLP
ncbi:unnamed protein product [Rhodiola kirilowii]